MSKLISRRFNMGVVLNGPPGCGKDTIANILVGKGDTDIGNFIPMVKHQFKDALYEHTAKHFNVDLDRFIHFASDRELKDSTSLAGLGGRTPRQALIHVSEDIFKPRFGNNYFGKVEAERVRELIGRMDSSTTVIYPDGGFPDEVLELDAVFDHVLIIRLHRDGFDFSGDSRDYISLPNTAKRTTVDENLVAGEAHAAAWIVNNWIERVRCWNNK